VPGHEVVDPEPAECLHHPVDPLGPEAREVEAADDGVDARASIWPASRPSSRKLWVIDAAVSPTTR
jgi:hypothetical protein